VHTFQATLGAFMNISNMRSFADLETYFRTQKKKAFCFLCLMWLVVLLLPGALADWHYTYTGFTLPVIAIAIFLALTVWPTLIPPRRILKEEYTLNAFNKETIRKIRHEVDTFTSMHKLAPISVHVSRKTLPYSSDIAYSQEGYVMRFSPEILTLDWGQIKAAVHHELGHVKNEDTVSLIWINKCRYIALMLSFFQFSFIEPQGALIYKFIALFLLWLYIEKHIRAWIYRQSEYLADIAVIQNTGDGQGLINYFHLVYKSYFKSSEIQLLARRHSAIVASGCPTPFKRVELLYNAQSLYNQSSEQGF
jgi:Zn-dependent protease with chaperone function